MFQRASFSTAVLLVVAIALAASGPACAIFGGCDQSDKPYCDGNTAHHCVRVCEGNGPDERCTNEWRWREWECEGCVMEGNDSRCMSAR